MRRGMRGMTRGRGSNKLAPDVPAAKPCTSLRSDPTRLPITVLVQVELSLRKTAGTVLQRGRARRCDLESLIKRICTVGAAVKNTKVYF